MKTKRKGELMIVFQVSGQVEQPKPGLSSEAAKAWDNVIQAYLNTFRVETKTAYPLGKGPTVVDEKKTQAAKKAADDAFMTEYTLFKANHYQEIYEKGIPAKTLLDQMEKKYNTILAKIEEKTQPIISARTAEASPMPTQAPVSVTGQLTNSAGAVDLVIGAERISVAPDLNIGATIAGAVKKELESRGYTDINVTYSLESGVSGTARPPLSQQ
jgi:hypothetical protein